MALQSEYLMFNSVEYFAEGWYWALPSKKLKKKQAAAVSLLGKDLVIYRGESGSLYALDAYCQHMGAHLGTGKVEGEHIRCLFHFWKYNSEGECIEIPCQKAKPCVEQLKSWPTSERYGLIWVWTGSEVTQPLPEVPELEGKEFSSVLGHHFEKQCHPSVVMINAIDEQHFISVHHVPTPLDMEPKVINRTTLEFTNIAPISGNGWLSKFLRLFYKNSITYNLSYWFGSTGCITIGPDFFHFYVMFALRPTTDGRTVGYAIPLTKKHKSLFGRIVNFIVLRLSVFVSNYFAYGDTIIFNNIKFNFKTPVKADKSIIEYIRHLEQQTPVRWGTWEKVSRDNLGNIFNSDQSNANQSLPHRLVTIRPSERMEG